jgi:photosystem II stability/assembly factor-like uncharacterized protein
MNVLVGTAEGLVADGRKELTGDPVRSLVDRAGSWWAVVGQSIMRRAGSDWEQIASVDGVRCVQPVDGVAVAGTAGAHLLRVGPEERQPLESFDRVPGRDEWHAVGSREPYVRSLSATADGVILANVHVGGIPRSTDGGTTWEPTIELDADVHQVRAHPERPELVLAAAAVGLCRSNDGGANWKVHTDGLHATYCRAVALAGDLMLVSASSGPFTEQGALYRRATDGDGAFERCSDGLPEWQPHNIDTGCLDTDGERAAFGGADGVVYGSEDAGRTWRVLADGLPSITAVAIA